MRNWSDEEMAQLLTAAKDSAAKMKTQDPGSSQFLDGLMRGYSFALELLQERADAKAGKKAA